MKRSSPHKSSLLSMLASNRAYLVRQATRVLHHVPAAEDAAHNAVVSALSHIDNFRGDAKLGTWLYRVGANSALMSLRQDHRTHQKNKRFLTEATHDPQWFAGHQHLREPYDCVRDAEQTNLVHWAVDQLPQRYKQVVELCDIQEKSTGEAALELGLTEGGVRTRRLRAHRMLRALLQKPLYEPSQRKTG